MGDWTRCTFASRGLLVIAASNQPRRPRALLCALKLASMRFPARVCNAARVSLQCVIVDDSDSFLDASRVLLERQGLEVVGVANTVAEAVQRAFEMRPDVMLVDVDLGGESGFTVVSRLAAEPDACPTILISTHAREDFADLVADSEALGFIAKSDLSAPAVRELLEAR